MLAPDQRFRRLAARIDTLGRGQVVIVTMAMIALIVLVDSLTGWRLRFSMFYILPVWIAAWRLGLGPGLGVAIAGAVAGSLANMGINEPAAAPSPLIGAWDIGARFVPLGIVAWLIVMQRAAIERERQLARTDALTGALNRRALLDEAERALARGQRLGLTTGFVYIDLDGFKAINDRHGHAVGDEVLVRFVALAQQRLRREDLVARVGGDEFVLLLVEATPDGAERAARRVCAELRDLLAAWQPPVRFCAGLCLVDAGAPQSPAEALAEADKMLYAAKRAADREAWFQVGLPDTAMRPTA